MAYIRRPKAVSAVAIARLALYLRTLDQLDAQVESISSKDLANLLAISPEQVRKDLSYFGDFGKQGKGYHACTLAATLRRILNAHRVWSVVLVGAGHLGTALLRSSDLCNQGFMITGVFDNDETLVGQKIDAHTVRHVSKLSDSIAAQQCRIGIICTPSHAAQDIADVMIESGVDSILNYAPVTLIVPESVQVQNIDPVACLRQMTYHLSKHCQVQEHAPDTARLFQENRARQPHHCQPKPASGVLEGLSIGHSAVICDPTQV